MFCYWKENERKTISYILFFFKRKLDYFYFCRLFFCIPYFFGSNCCCYWFRHHWFGWCLSCCWLMAVPTERLGSKFHWWSSVVSLLSSPVLLSLLILLLTAVINTFYFNLYGFFIFFISSNSWFGFSPIAISHSSLLVRYECKIITFFIFLIMKYKYSRKFCWLQLCRAFFYFHFRKIQRIAERETFSFLFGSNE